MMGQMIMNADRRKALIAAAVIRAKLLGLELGAALEIAIQNGGAQVSKIERAGLLRSAQSAYDGHWPDKPGQIELAV